MVLLSNPIDDDTGGRIVLLLGKGTCVEDGSTIIDDIELTELLGTGDGVLLTGTTIDVVVGAGDGDCSTGDVGDVGSSNVNDGGGPGSRAASSSLVMSRKSSVSLMFRRNLWPIGAAVDERENRTRAGR